MNGNGKHTAIIAIIVSVIVAASGISFGVIQGAAKDDISEFRTKIERHEEMIGELRIQKESDHKDIEYIKRDLEEIKADIKDIKSMLQN